MISKINWKNQFIFITKHVNAYIGFHLNLAKIFFLHGKLNPIIIKITNKLFMDLWTLYGLFMESSGLVICLSSFLSIFLILFGCSFEGSICLTWHHKNIFDLCFWCWLVLFLDVLIQLVSSCKNFLITVNVLRLDWFNNPARSFINPNINQV